MNVYDFLHLSLYAVGGHIHDVRVFQQLLSSLIRLMDYEDKLDCPVRPDSPCSVDIIEHINTLVSRGYLTKCRTGMEVEYKISVDGIKRAEVKTRLYLPLWKELQDIIMCCNCLRRLKETYK